MGHRVRTAALPRSTEVEALAAGLLLAALRRNGIDYLFGNAGTDFVSIIEAYATETDPGAFPKPVLVPHENLAVAMAHGAYLATDKPQAVMVHVGVGTANALCGLINAARANVPLFLCAGRTPITEAGDAASRNAFIHWAQESFDQAAMVREWVKWDYEMRRGDQAEAIVDRALAIAVSQPRGPVYATLPREVLAERIGHQGQLAATVPATEPFPDPDAIAQASAWLKDSKRPLIVTADYGRSAADVRALSEFANSLAIPVVTHRPRVMPLTSDDPAFVAFESGQLVEESDLILVVACDVPWIPRDQQPRRGVRVIHFGSDPLFARYPMRGFRTDLAITGNVAVSLRSIRSSLGPNAAIGQQRRARLQELRRAFEREATPVACPETTATPAWIASCLAQQRRAGDAYFVETAFPAALLTITEPCSYFAAPSAGGLGWALGAALGYKLATSSRRVISIVGDGAYMFGNPTPAHFVAAANNLPTLTIILNNRMWAAVRRATLAVYADSTAARGQSAVFTYLEPTPDYQKVVLASGGYGEKVERADALPAALERAFHAVEHDRRAAVLNIIVD
jgi:acetolactate synthase-1/2/3 large subunit